MRVRARVHTHKHTQTHTHTHDCQLVHEVDVFSFLFFCGTKILSIYEKNLRVQN